MVSKRYHFVLNSGVICNFYISINPVNPGSCARGSITVGELRCLGSPFSINPPTHYQ